MDQQTKDRTPTETLMNVLEEFGQSEAKSVVVIWTDDDGNINWSRSSNLGVTGGVGMLECVKAIMLSRFCAEDRDGG